LRSLPVVFSATKKGRFQQKVMDISALLERPLLLNFTSYRNFQTGQIILNKVKKLNGDFADFKGTRAKKSD
tara:strand:- start:185 stop:397 length:213 start_codon:yes stop_codon:yes gene_type:complete